MLMSATPYRFDLQMIKQDVQWITEKYNLPQIGLTHTNVNLSAIEKITESAGSNFDYTSGKYRFNESDFTQFNTEFQNTYLYEIYKSIPEIGRFRIMSMPGPSCYTLHRDLSKRYHIAIQTNQDCLFMFPDVNKHFRIPADGMVYSLDTRFRHTFLNGSKSIRIHLVMDDLSSLKK